MSRFPLVSPDTRLVASDSKATKRPSGEIDVGPYEWLLPSDSSLDTLTLTRVLRIRSLTKTSWEPFSSGETRLVAPDWKTT